MESAELSQLCHGVGLFLALWTIGDMRRVASQARKLGRTNPLVDGPRVVGMTMAALVWWLDLAPAGWDDVSIMIFALVMGLLARLVTGFVLALVVGLARHIRQDAQADAEHAAKKRLPADQV